MGVCMDGWTDAWRYGCVYVFYFLFFYMNFHKPLTGIYLLGSRMKDIDSQRFGISKRFVLVEEAQPPNANPSKAIKLFWLKLLLKLHVQSNLAIRILLLIKKHYT